ncbi:MAG: hypothetical protein MJ211_03955 [Bacteroidales bacterium]|nr:hypothetical protein [Bacteroidales bacterium]
MKTLKIILIILLFFTTKSYSQSDDGWFTGKITCGIAADKYQNYPQINCAYFYNFENHFSIATQSGLIFYDTELMPIESCLRIRPIGKKEIMPALNLSYGYAISFDNKYKGGQIFSPAISFETGFIKRVNYVIEFGGQFFKLNSRKIKNWFINFGIEI